MGGSGFEALASSVLQTALSHALERIVDPVGNKTLRVVRAEKGGRL